jgi:hypothetical protein
MAAECAALLVLQEGSLDDFTIRLADMYIHALFSYPNTSGQADLRAEFERYSDDPLERHRQHEIFLERKFRRCEEAVFNDPTVKYPSWRPYLSGETGTMSQLILNGYYQYYTHLVDRGIRFNGLADCQVLLTQLVESTDLARLTAADWRAIREIFTLGSTVGFGLPPRRWWSSVLEYLDAKKDALTRWEFWRNNPERRTWDQFWSWQPSSDVLAVNRPRIPLAEGLPEGKSYGVYEYYPFIPSNEQYPTTAWGFTSGSGAAAFTRDFANTKAKFELLRSNLSGSNATGGRRQRRRKTRKQQTRRQRTQSPRT